MTRAKENKLYRNFTKGLITEAGFLTYPEDASTDELNTVIQRKGNRNRRLGIDYEEDSTAVSITAYDPTVVTSEFFWRAPANKSALNFVVVQVGHALFFFDTASTPLSEGEKPFLVDIRNFKSVVATEEQVINTPVQMSSGKGFLFVASEHIDPFTVEYDPDTDTISAVRIFILMRDFDGVNDTYPNDYEPSTLTKEHHYNLRNQGWVVPGTPSVDGGVPGGGGGGGGTPEEPDTPLPPGSGGQTYYDPYSGVEYEWNRERVENGDAV